MVAEKCVFENIFSPTDSLTEIVFLLVKMKMLSIMIFVAVVFFSHRFQAISFLFC